MNSTYAITSSRGAAHRHVTTGSLSRPVVRRSIWIVMLVALTGPTCRRLTTLPANVFVQPIATPAPAGSIVPQASKTSTGDILLSWLEPRSDRGYRFRVALRHGEAWTPPVLIDDSPDVSMFGADLPGVAELPGGAWLAYWQRTDTKAVDDPYATTIHLSRSVDHGLTWMALPSPHRDGVSGQHSFLSPFVAGQELGLVWLDAQQQHHVHAQTANGKDEYLGAVGLRYASFASDGTQHADTFIDPITCECCPTAAAVSARGPVVAYRDRATPAGANPEEIRYDSPTVRDIHVVRLEDGRWTSPRRVYADNWVINGCPDNGPAVDAVGHQVVVAWWTAANNHPHVSVAFSDDAGDTFGAPIRVDLKAAEGHVTIAAVDEGQGAVVGWLEDHTTYARWVGHNGRLGPPVSLGPAPNHARLPRWFNVANDVRAIWSEEARGQRSVHMARLVRE
jgi:hypothetical protein